MNGEGYHESGRAPLVADSNRSFIEENLRYMAARSQKKRIAQEKYYAAMNGRSPLIRNNKLPVHQRLGRRQPKFLNIPLGTNTSNIPPKNRYQQDFNRRRYTNFVSGGGVSKTFRAQNRINRIRQQQALTRGLFPNNQMPSPARPFRLRRTLLPNESFTNYHSGFNDLTVQVSHPVIKRFKIQLNPERQAEIRLMREKTVHVVYDLRERIQEVHATDITLNRRFSNYN